MRVLPALPGTGRRALRDRTAAARPGRPRAPGPHLLRRRRRRGVPRECVVNAARGDVVAAVEGLHVRFPVRTSSGKREVHAVDGVSFEITRGDTLGLVGESGSGKSTTGLALLRLVNPSAGTIRILGEDVTSWPRRRLRALRRRVAMVFQDPQSALDPRLSI